MHRDTEARTSIPEPQLTFRESNISDQPTESRNFACVVCSYRSSALNDIWVKKKGYSDDEMQNDKNVKSVQKKETLVWVQ